MWDTPGLIYQGNDNFEQEILNSQKILSVFEKAEKFKVIFVIDF